MCGEQTQTFIDWFENFLYVYTTHVFILAQILSQNYSHYTRFLPHSTQIYKLLIYEYM